MKKSSVDERGDEEERTRDASASSVNEEAVDRATAATRRRQRESRDVVRHRANDDSVDGKPIRRSEDEDDEKEKSVLVAAAIMEERNHDHDRASRKQEPTVLVPEKPNERLDGDMSNEEVDRMAENFCVPIAGATNESRALGRAVNDRRRLPEAEMVVPTDEVVLMEDEENNGDTRDPPPIVVPGRLVTSDFSFRASWKQPVCDGPLWCCSFLTYRRLMVSSFVALIVLVVLVAVLLARSSSDGENAATPTTTVAPSRSPSRGPSTTPSSAAPSTMPSFERRTPSPTTVSLSDFRLERRELTWREHRDLANSQGYSLVSIRNERDDSFVRNVTAHVYDERYVWTGGARTTSGSPTWVWADGEPFTYEKWAPNEPNDANGEEDCVELILRTGEWNDQNCEDTLYAVYRKSTGDDASTTNSYAGTDAPNICC